LPQHRDAGGVDDFAVREQRGAGDVRARQNGRGKISVCNNSVVQIGVAKIGVAQIGVAQIGVAQIGIAQVRRFQVATL
jgi:hypothetical protein